MRHTLAAQVLAKAIKNLYPESKLAIGPTIENGFYYDVECPKTISVDDLEIKNSVIFFKKPPLKPFKTPWHCFCL